MVSPSHHAGTRLSAEHRADLLRATPLGALDDEAMAEMLGLFVSKRVARGAIVFLEGDAGDRFFLVAQGYLKAFRHAPHDREITVFTLRRGDFFGLLPLLDGQPYPLSVSALRSSELLVLQRSDFLRFTRSHPSFALALLADLAHRLRGCLDQVETLGRQGAAARVAHGLLSLAGSNAAAGGGLTVTLPFTQAEFAQLLHVTPENLSRALTRLRRDRLVERLGGGRFRIPDPKELRRIGDGD